MSQMNTTGREPLPPKTILAAGSVAERHLALNTFAAKLQKSQALWADHKSSGEAINVCRGWRCSRLDDAGMTRTWTFLDAPAPISSFLRRKNGD